MAFADTAGSAGAAGSDASSDSGTAGGGGVRYGYGRGPRAFAVVRTDQRGFGLGRGRHLGGGSAPESGVDQRGLTSASDGAPSTVGSARSTASGVTSEVPRSSQDPPTRRGSAAGSSSAGSAGSSDAGLSD